MQSFYFGGMRKVFQSRLLHFKLFAFQLYVFLEVIKCYFSSQQR